MTAIVTVANRKPMSLNPLRSAIAMLRLTEKSNVGAEKTFLKNCGCESSIGGSARNDSNSRVFRKSQSDQNLSTEKDLDGESAKKGGTLNLFETIAVQNRNVSRCRLLVSHNSR